VSSRTSIKHLLQPQDNLLLPRPPGQEPAHYRLFLRQETTGRGISDVARHVLSELSQPHFTKPTPHGPHLIVKQLISNNSICSINSHHSIVGMVCVKLLSLLKTSTCIAPPDRSQDNGESLDSEGGGRQLQQPKASGRAHGTRRITPSDRSWLLEHQTRPIWEASGLLCYRSSDFGQDDSLDHAAASSARVLIQRQDGPGVARRLRRAYGAASANGVSSSGHLKGRSPEETTMQNLRNTERPSTERIRRQYTSCEQLEAGTVAITVLFAGTTSAHARRRRILRYLVLCR